MGNRVLLVEDDEDFAAGLERLLRRAGYEVTATRSGAESRTAATRIGFDLALLDLHLPDGDGVDLIAQLQQLPQPPKVVCLTGDNEAASALRAIRAGASDYLIKPIAKEALLRAVTAALGPGPDVPAAAVRQLTLAPDEPVGHSAGWRRARELLAAVAKSPRTTVLLTGEPGVGKEVAAGLVHRMSPRARGPLVTANAACLSPALVESELFGHEAGSFTGAHKRRRGYFELAAGGTLMLDEVGELPLEVQAKLLRVLEGQPFRRLGGEQELLPDARLIAATNRDLGRLVAQGQFRADLYERLRVFEVHLPPLRERRDDIAPLAAAFCRKLSASLGVPPAPLTAEALDYLQRHTWPGNIRELRNVIERGLVLAAGAPLGIEHLPGLTDDREAPSPLLEDVIRVHVTQIYLASQRNLTHAAARLGISRLALRRRLREYGLKSAEDEPDPVAIEPAPVRSKPAT